MTGRRSVDLTMADLIRFYNRESIQILIWGTACLDKLRSMKKIYGHHAFYFVGGISKVGDEQFVFAKKIEGNSLWATQKLQ